MFLAIALYKLFSQIDLILFLFILIIMDGRRPSPTTYLQHETRGIMFGGHIGNSATGTSPWDRLPLHLDRFPTIFTFSGSQSFFQLRPIEVPGQEPIQRISWYDRPNLFEVRLPIGSKVICTTRCEGLTRRPLNDRRRPL